MIKKIDNRITLKIKTYYLELLTLETMGLLETSKSKITKNQNGESVPYLEITEVVLMHSYVVNNNYQQNSKKWIHKKSSGQLLDTCPKYFILLKTFDSEFSYIEVWFTDQNSKPIAMEDMGKNVGKYITKNISSKYCQKSLDYGKQSGTDALKMLQKEQFKKQQKQLVI